MKRGICLTLCLAVLLMTLSFPALADDAPHYDTLQDASEYLYQQARLCKPEITVYVSSAEVKRLGREIPDRARAYVQQFSTYCSWWESGKIVIEPTYYPGTRIAYAYDTGSRSMLTSRESSAMDVAIRVAREAMMNTSSEYERAKYLHDWLCKNVNYYSYNAEDDIMQDCENALGGLLDGRANCQGYADSFCLLGHLAGLDVRSMHGKGDGDWHRWNTIRMNGSWYFVDVTYDDVSDAEYSDALFYAYFCVGKNMFGNHTWDSWEENVPLSSYTDWDLFPYTNGIGTYADGFESGAAFAFNARRDNGQRVYHLMLQGSADWQTLSNAIKKLANKRSGSCSWYIYTKSHDGYGFYDVIWTKWN